MTPWSKISPQKIVPGPEKKIKSVITHPPSGSQETKKGFDILIFDEDGRMQNLQA